MRLRGLWRGHHVCFRPAIHEADFLDSGEARAYALGEGLLDGRVGAVVPAPIHGSLDCGADGGVGMAVDAGCVFA